MPTLEVNLGSLIQPEIQTSTPGRENLHETPTPHRGLPRRIHYFFESSADRADPHAIAVVSNGERLTYAELESGANTLAHVLIARGAAPGRTVGILLNRSTSTYVALLAVLKAGSAFVPIDPSYPANRVAFMVADAGMALVLTTSDLAASHRGLPCAVLCLD